MLTVTLTPAIIYLMMTLIPPSPGGLPYAEVYRTDDKVACEEQVTSWNKLLGPNNKFICVSHNQEKLLDDVNGGKDSVQFFTVTLPPAPGHKSFNILYRATDKAICDAQAIEWTAALPGAKFACVKHNKLKLQTNEVFDEEL